MVEATLLHFLHAMVYLLSAQFVLNVGIKDFIHLNV